MSLTIGQEGDEGAAVTPSVVHELPLRQLIDSSISRVAMMTRALGRYEEAHKAGRPHQFLTPAERDQASRGAVASQRGRPVRDETLRRVAEIVKASGDFGYRELIRKEFSVSTRTASRWVQQAIQREFLTEEVTGE